MRRSHPSAEEMVGRPIPELRKKDDLDFTQPLAWVCPRCGTPWLVPGLADQRCAHCGYREAT